MSEKFDLIIIGGGRASTLAIAAAKEGWKTALIERDQLGGACPNHGCVPSKLFIGFADAARHVRHADRHFIDAEFRTIDLRKLFASVNDYVGGVDGRYQQRIEKSGVTLIRGEARFTDLREITVNDRTITAEKIVIATGARPSPPPFTELPVWTSDSLFPLESRPPQSLIIVGGGIIGCEMASFFTAIGTKVNLFTRGDRLLGREDEDIEKIFQTEFTKDVQCRFNSELTDLRHDGSKFTATFQVGHKTETIQADNILFSIGRIPNSEALDLAKTGLSADQRGFIPVNEHLETSEKGIYATGDVNGRDMLQHAAAREVHYLREKFLKNETAPLAEIAMPHGIFSHPEIASVGLTEQQAIEQNIPHIAVIEDWLASARAMAMRIEYPRVKLVVSTADHSILGCHLIGPESTTIIQQALAIMHLKNDVRELANMIYIHPALNECLLAAAVKAVTMISRKRPGT